MRTGVSYNQLTWLRSANPEKTSRKDNVFYSKAKVLIVECNSSIRQTLSSTLSLSGIKCIDATDSIAMFLRLADQPDLIILDLKLPDTDGLALLNRLRQQSEIPIIIYSARSDETEKIACIEMGADDYLTKACNPREFIARIGALLRRTWRRKDKSPVSGRLYKFDRWILNTATRDLVDLESNSANIGSIAMVLVIEFVERPHQVLSREMLSTLLRRKYDSFDRVIDVHVSNIRRALGKQENGEPFIKTVRLHGYTFVAPVENSG